MDAQHTGSVIDIGPHEAQGLTDVQPGVGQQLEQRPVRARVVEDAGEVVAFEDADALDACGSNAADQRRRYRSSVRWATRRRGVSVMRACSGREELGLDRAGGVGGAAVAGVS
jgi:hypothetical protein